MLFQGQKLLAIDSFFGSGCSCSGCCSCACSCNSCSCNCCVCCCGISAVPKPLTFLNSPCFNSVLCKWSVVAVAVALVVAVAVAVAVAVVVVATSLSGPTSPYTTCGPGPLFTSGRSPGLCSSGPSCAMAIPVQPGVTQSTDHAATAASTGLVLQRRPPPVAERFKPAENKRHFPKPCPHADGDK